jgi:hypothetical protein
MTIKRSSERLILEKHDQLCKRVGGDSDEEKERERERKTELMLSSEEKTKKTLQ